MTFARARLLVRPVRNGIEFEVKLLKKKFLIRNILRKMPFRRRRFGKRKFKGRRPGTKKSNNMKKMMGHVERGLSFGFGLAKKVKFLSGLINVEKKFVNISNSASVSNSVSSYSIVMSQIAEGDDVAQRNGRSVLYDSLNIHWSAKIHASATNTLIKIVVVCDKKPDIGAANFGTVFGNSTTVNGHIDKLTEGDRFVIMKVVLVRLNSGEGLAQTGKMYIGLKGVHGKFDGTGATDYEGNVFYIMALSDEATNTPTLAFDSRLSYFDN